MKPLTRLLLFLSLLSSPALAQIATTSLRGTVTDSSGAVVGGAQVSLLDSSNGSKATHTTSANGEYSFAQIAPGSYSITAAASGFANLEKKAELLVNQPATIDFKLSVTSQQQEVEVNALSETLNTSDASLGNALNSATIEALPSEGRNVPDLLSLQPGVVYLGRQINQDQDSRSGSVAGARSDQSNVTLDGVDNNDQTKGYAFTGILRSTLDSVEEFRVTTTSSNADSGRSSGAQVNVVTKSGTNAFHGSLYEYFRNTYFAANDWFNKQAQAASGEPNKPGTLNRNTYGAAVGGPIKTNKLFFFMNYEGQRTSENQQETMTVPTTSMRQGMLQYTNADGGNTTLTPAQLAGMDPHCGANGTCPWGAGVDPNVLTVLNQYPAANGFSTGDGLNSGSFTFSATDPATLNTYIAKLDYTLNDRQRLFVRGNLLGDRSLGVPQFPGQLASTQIVNNSKGIAAGDVWTISNNLINNFRYGYVWQGLSTIGAGSASFVSFSALSSPLSQNRTNLQSVPMHNVVDDFTFTKGRTRLSSAAIIA
jgi:Carboxypeptidase regulatory-like domain